MTAVQYSTAHVPAGRRGRTRRLRPVTLLVILTLVLPLIVAARVVQVAQRDDRVPVDAVVVLGAAANDGAPGRVLEARLSHALELYSAGVAPVIVTAGGTGQGQQVSEAAAGADWLAGQGVPDQSIVAVGVGGDTLSSLEAVAAEARERGWGSVVLVSDPWHLYRTRAMAEDVGLPVSGTSPATSGPNVERSDRIAFNVVRETAAFLVYRAGTLAARLGDAVDAAVTGR